MVSVLVGSAISGMRDGAGIEVELGGWRRAFGLERMESAASNVFSGEFMVREACRWWGVVNFL